MSQRLSMSYESSYFFGNDTISGWGPRYFFSFYSEYGEKRSGTIFEVFAFAVIFLFSMVINGLMGAAVFIYPEMRTIANCFLLNLAAADILFVAGIPALIYTRLHQEWKLGNYVCKVLPYSQFVSSFVLLWTLVWIGMDRHNYIVVPPFRSKLTSQRARLLSVITWLVASIIFLPVFFWFGELTTNNQLHICTLVFPKNDVVNVSFLFLVPTLLFSCIVPLTMFAYYHHQIYRKLKKTKDKTSETNQKELAIINPDLLLQKERIQLKRYMRMIRMLLLNVLIVLIMWLPITSILFLIFVDGSRPNYDTNSFLRSHHCIWTLLIAQLSTVFYPLLISKSFRKCFLGNRLLSKLCKVQTTQVKKPT